MFDDWYAAGPEADDKWRDYEKARGHSYLKALEGHAARNVFAFDKRHLDSSDAAVLVLPAGKSGHLELGYMIGCGKPCFILLDNPERWDVMYQFAHFVTDDQARLCQELQVSMAGITKGTRFIPRYRDDEPDGWASGVDPIYYYET